jgi:hypothetical protein
MRSPKTPAQTNYESLEQQYGILREAADQGIIPPADLEALAQRVTAAAQIWAIQKGWVLPEVK